MSARLTNGESGCDIVQLEPAPSISPAAGQAPDTDRIVAIDVLRGFALLGILVMNIQSVAMPDAAYMNPTAYGEFTGANFRVWLLSHVLADQKMMTIFSMLFGAGIVLMTGRAKATSGHSAAIHYRRMLAMLVFGLLHGYLLWYGDILYSYAMCGLVVYLCRNLRPWLLLGLGFISIAIPSVISLFFGWSMQYWPSADKEEFIHEMWQPTAEMIAEQLAAYRGDWIGEIVHRAPTIWAFQTFFFAIFVAWRAGGLMLVGMALFKLGVFSAARSTATYLTFITLAILVGIPAILYGAYGNIQAGWDANYSFSFGGEYNYWASILVGVG